MSRHSEDEDISDRDRQILHKLEERGWFVTAVAADATGPGFVYSFGLFETFKHPELIVYGLDGAIMIRLINDAGELIRTGQRWQAGDRSDDLLDGYPCAFRPVDPLHYRQTLSYAVWFYKSLEFPALQMFWPDNDSHFPWEKGFEDSIRSLQPDLSEPEAP